MYRVTDEPEDLDARAARDEKVSRLGFRPTLKHVQDTYGGEWLESNPPAPMPGEVLTPSAISDASFAQAGRTVVELLQRHHAAAFAEAALVDPAVLMAQQLNRTLAPAGAQWVEQIRGAVNGATSLESLYDQVFALAPEMDLEAFAKAKADAMTAATLAGRYDLLPPDAGA